jgi:hypothetical protein
MQRPFAHTLTPADRHLISRWLLGISAIFGMLTLLIVGVAVATHYRGADTATETAATQASER